MVSRASTDAQGHTRVVSLAVILILMAGSLLVLSGCGGDDDDAPAPQAGTEAAKNATVADLENKQFAFVDGLAFDATLAGQRVSLAFGPIGRTVGLFELTVPPGGRDRGRWALESHLQLSFTDIQNGSLFREGQELILNATIQEDGRLALQNIATQARSVSDGPGQPVILGAGPPSGPGPNPVDAILSSDQVVPPSPSTGSGVARLVTFRRPPFSITYTVNYTLPNPVTEVHLHKGSLGTNGPIMLFLCTNLGNAPQEIPTPQACPPSPGTLTGTFTEKDFLAVEGAMSFEEAFNVIEGDGNAYLDVHSTAFEAGEIRGQVMSPPPGREASLNGAQEVPPVETQARGSVSF